MHRTLARMLLLSSALLAAACASTTLRDSWYDPAYNRGAFKKWLVVGAGTNVVAQRTLEDAMVAQLRARGVEALPGYQFLPAGMAGEAQLDGAVAVSGADGLMLIRLAGVETRTQVSTAMVPGPMVGRAGWWGTYSTWHAVPQVSQTQVVRAETSVFEVYQRSLVWSGVTETFDPSSVAREAPGFADAIVRALAQRGLVPAAK